MLLYIYSYSHEKTETIKYINVFDVYQYCNMSSGMRIIFYIFWFGGPKDLRDPWLKILFSLANKSAIIKAPSKFLVASTHYLGLSSLGLNSTVHKWTSWELKAALVIIKLPNLPSRVQRLHSPPFSLFPVFFFWAVPSPSIYASKRPEVLSTRDVAVHLGQLLPRSKYRHFREN